MSQTAPHKIQLEVFEGPLDLLLYLVRRAEVDIYDVTLEQITTQYLDSLQDLHRVDIDQASDFIAMAANLIYWKSRSLLPVEDQEDQEALDEDFDPQWELIRRLIEYKKFKEAAAILRDRQLEQEGSFRRSADIRQVQKFEDESLFLEEVSMLDLMDALQRVLKRIEKKGSVREIHRDHWTVGDKIKYLLEITQIGRRTPFSSLFDKAGTRVEVVVTFLALLELIRLRHLRVTQNHGFDEIFIERQPLGMPGEDVEGDEPREAHEPQQQPD
jgi:segregation and condensation protein A